MRRVEANYLSSEAFQLFASPHRDNAHRLWLELLGLCPGSVKDHRAYRYFYCNTWNGLQPLGLVSLTLCLVGLSWHSVGFGGTSQ